MTHQEPALQFQLLHAGYDNEIALNQEAVTNGNARTGVLASSDGVGRQIGKDGDRSALSVVHDRDWRDDRPPVCIHSGQNTGCRLSEHRSCPLGVGWFQHSLLIGGGTLGLEAHCSTPPPLRLT